MDLAITCFHHKLWSFNVLLFSGIGDQIARKLEEAWDIFRSQNPYVPSLKQIRQMKRGEFLQYLNHPKFKDRKFRPPRTVQSSADVDITKSKRVKHSAEDDVDVENVKPSHNCIRKRHRKAVDPLQLSEKIVLESEGTSCSSVTINKPYCAVRAIRRFGPLDVNIANHVTYDSELISPVADDKAEQISNELEEYGDSLIYHPSTFKTAQV